MWKKTLTTAVIGYMVVGLTSAHAMQLNVSTTQTADDPLIAGFELFKQNVEDRTNGDIQVRIFPSSQLGDTQDVMEQAMAGANTAALTDAAYLADYVPEIGVLNSPYVFDGYEEAARFVETDLFNEWEKAIEEQAGIVVLSFNWYQGARHIFSKEEIHEPSDLEGMRVRTPQAPIWTESMAALGATPTPLAWGEVYSAMQTDVIDGAGAQIMGGYGTRFHEVSPYISLTRHIELITALVVGRDWFYSLPEEYQIALKEEARNGGRHASEVLLQRIEEVKSAIPEETGTQLIEVDEEVFKQSVSDYGYYEKMELQEAYDAVQEALSSSQ